MLALICKTRRRITTTTSCSQISKTHYLGFLGFSTTVASISSTKIQESDEICPKHDPLAMCCRIGISPQVAVSVSRRVKFESLDVPDSICALLRNHGFDNAQISSIIARTPNVLLCHPRVILPKLEFFASIGISNDVILKNPYLLERSLDNKLIPCYDFIKGLLLSEKQMANFWRRLPWNFVTKLDQTVGPNVDYLKEVGVSSKNIEKLFIRAPGILSQENDKLKNLVDEIVKLGFEPSRVHFVKALPLKFQMSKWTWKHKFEVYKKWGWSEQDVIYAFKRQPFCMAVSEEKITRVMDFVVNKMGIESTAVAERPTILTMSVDLRIIPRCSVIRVLQAKDLIEESFNLNAFTFLFLTDKLFVDKYITKYQEQLPQLLAVYQGKVENVELSNS